MSLLFFFLFIGFFRGLHNHHICMACWRSFLGWDYMALRVGNTSNTRTGLI